MRILHCLLLTVVLVSVLPDPVIGQTEVDSTAQPDTTQRAPGPRTAFLLGLIPGGGQLYNGKWLKAIIVIAADGYFFHQFQQALKSYNDYDASYPTDENPYLEERNKFAWQAMFVYILGLMDGYVDAHLSTFPPDSLYQAQLSSPLDRPLEEGP